VLRRRLSSELSRLRRAEADLGRRYEAEGRYMIWQCFPPHVKIKGENGAAVGGDYAGCKPPLPPLPPFASTI